MAPNLATSSTWLDTAMPVIFGFVLLNAALITVTWAIWYERKFAGAMQNRPGPTEVGPFGLLQPVADIVKMLQKEDIVPDSADKALFNLAPPLTVILVLGILAVIPFGSWVVADLDIGLVFALAMGSLLVVPVWMAGWASNNKYALLGAMRSAAQAISYEIPLLLCAMVPVILAGSFNLGEIQEAQVGMRWFVLWPPGPGFFAFVLFFLCSLAEANRIPFDIPEAESELVAGITTEYTGMKFGLFYLAEYLHTLIASALASVIFLGGADSPFVAGPGDLLGAGPQWMVAKTLFLFAGIFWIRWSILRYRQDQLLRICWVWFLPISLCLVAASALWVGLGLGG
jgi:NADH-quinone oxidoreductase subunit H